MTQLLDSHVSPDIVDQEEQDVTNVQATSGSRVRCPTEARHLDRDKRIHEDEVESKLAYRSLKRKVQSLLYEQECFYEELRRLQRKLLRINRDKSFLLDRLLQYELPDFSSSDGEETASSSADEVDRSYFKSDSKPVTPIKQSSKKSTSASAKTSKLDQSGKAQPKARKAIENVERVRCKQIENGKRCPKMVSKRVKNGLCLVHRQPQSTESEKKLSASETPDRSGPVRHRPTSSKQTHVGPPLLSPMISGGFINDDLPEADDRDMQQEMFDIANNISNSGHADSPASPDFHSNMYDGDDDLVIDLPE